MAKKAPIKSAEAGAAVAALLSTITEQLAAGQEVAIPDFGTFAVKSREARSGRNPRTGESITIAADKMPTFRPSKGLKDALG